MRPVQMLGGVVGLSVLWTVACGGHTPVESEIVAAQPSAAGPDHLLGAGGQEPGSGFGPSARSERPCIISADCPAGNHCDLGECRRRCSTAEPCAAPLVCSPRGRCVGVTEGDADPPPPTESVGAVSLSPASVRLTDADRELHLTLSSTSQDSVEYRVQIDAPHLSVDSTRGQFVGSTSLVLQVDPTRAGGRDTPGTVKVFTTLGDRVVSAPLHVGVTGRYQGSFRYDAGVADLGDARVALELHEGDGNVAVRVDPERSLLFPETGGRATFGFGSYVPGERLDLTLEQALDGGFGGAASPFGGRPLGRRLRVAVVPQGGGRLSGSFDETIYGLFAAPVTLSGSVVLELQPGLDVAAFEPISQPMPASPVNTCCLSTARLFAGPGTCFVADPGQWLSRYYGPLLASHGQPDVSYADLVDGCSAALGLSESDGSSANCGSVGALACASADAVRRLPTDADNVAAFNAYTLGMADVAALVAQDHMVQAVRDSFLSRGLNAERLHYDTAADALLPVSTWLMQAAVLQFLRDVPPDLAEAPGRWLTEAGTASGADAFPVARALAGLIRLSGEVEAERARIAGLERAEEAADPAHEAQSRALLAHLMTAALVGVLDQWGTSPLAVGATIHGVLGDLDRGFGAAVDGARGLGVPTGHVPFVYRADDTGNGATNFEQKLTTASRAVEQHGALEAEVLASAREFDRNDYALDEQLSAVRFGAIDELQTLCGAEFSPEQVISPEDWSSCGTTSGEVMLARLRVEQSEAALQSHLSRMESMERQIEVRHRALADTQEVHHETLSFISETGDELNAITVSQGILNAVESALQIAANVSIGNAGAPAAMAGVVLAMQPVRTSLAVRREQLQTAQTMRVEQASAEIEFINGMADIQRQIIDLEQLGVEAHEVILAGLDGQMQLHNAVARAKQVHERWLRGELLADRNPAGDPAFRIVRDQLTERVLAARARAQRELLLAGRALEYEVNQSLPALEGAVLHARNAVQLGELSRCFESLFDQHLEQYGSAQEYVTTISVRQMLGVVAPRTDEVTGQLLSEGEQFRKLVLRNENLDADGGARIRFSTNLQPGNQLWSADVCNDRITGVQAQLVGDFLGDDEAEVRVELSGGAVMRACDAPEVRTWALRSERSTVVAAGTNSFGQAAANTALFGQPVARTNWDVVVTGGTRAPANADVDLSRLEDVVLRVTHGAVALPRTGGSRLDTSCLSSSP